ncbi:methyltransferase domain-containing protein [Agrobacterium pusense]|jgi:glycosyltransferase involved in cell wall biosynthesis/2-polyprenyl-3-methyl-5-hydroxy-6-metoxy-1,4-benzoquinol methylase|uniref:methyltransferase domain-containing protein n=1 Tax=Agrobacterium pusense TaxID=648995 RepID=UPI002452F214|nr:methyltransferase domain-containing protein [Agrobacterium pusense]
MLNSEGHYDNPFEWDNVYGHTIKLLTKYLGVDARERGQRGVHLDLGCGYGRIAERVVADFQVDYVGIDGASEGIASLRARGFEAHELLFDTYDQTFAGIERILDGRNVSSLTLLDTLEHLTNGEMVLEVLRELIKRNNAPAVVSVPNVAHMDIGFKLALGNWSYTREGLLDHTHVRLYSEATLKRTLGTVGLHMVDQCDVNISESDQAFPRTHPALATGTTLNQILSMVRNNTDRTAHTNQFVRLVVAGPKTRDRSYLSDEEKKPSRPFLSIITRTQGKRLHCLVEVLTALSAQSDRDFEVIVIAHKVPADRQLKIERVLDDSPNWLREKIRFLKVDDGNRTRPLNVGFEQAEGEYISILDDDDVPMAHWVSTFRDLAQKKPGALLRTIAARQEIETVRVNGEDGIRATGPLVPYAAEFDLIQHLVANQTPPVALAFPRGVFHDLNVRFDESLTTTEDWDYLLRVALIVGVSWCDEVTAVYHWWKLSEESSRTDHDQAEWTANHLAINRKIDMLPIILPAGSARYIRELRTLANSGWHTPGEVPSSSAYREEVRKILSSKSWRWSQPLRWPAMIRGRRDITISDLENMSELQLADVLQRLKRSSSWRRTRIFRRGSRK